MPYSPPPILQVAATTSQQELQHDSTKIGDSVTKTNKNGKLKHPREFLECLLLRVLV
jgi:hypothetical protein